MNEDMEKLRREMELLRRELRSAAPGAIRHLDQLLVAAPAAEVARAQAHGSKPEQRHGQPEHEHPEDAHDEHHRHPLPFVVVDESGKPIRIVKPATEKLMGVDPGPDPGLDDLTYRVQVHVGHDHGASNGGHRYPPPDKKGRPKKK